MQNETDACHRGHPIDCHAGPADDACNGTTVNRKYVYALTETFPYVPRCLNSTPDRSLDLNRRQ
jgi:hypothetical protein